MSERLLCGYFSQVFDAFETDTLMEMMAGFLLVDHCSGFPLFRADKIPWYFHDFSRFFSKFPGIIFIIFKVWFLSGFEYEYVKLLSFIWIKN